MMIHCFRGLVVSSALLVLGESVAKDVWWCELADELCELGSGSCAHARASQV